MVDPLRVRTLLDRLAAEVEALRRLGARSTGELLAHDDLLAAVKYLRDTARFRNLLVHNYTKVDDTRVVEILGERVDDLALFRTALARAAGG